MSPLRYRSYSSGPGGFIIVALFLIVFTVFGILAIVNRKKQEKPVVTYPERPPFSSPPPSPPPLQQPQQPVEQKKEGFNGRRVAHPMSHGRVFIFR